jgi:VanZ like family
MARQLQTTRRLGWVFCLYLSFIVYQTLAHDDGWACGHLGWESFMLRHRPSRGDVLANVVAYMPLGFFAALALKRFARGWWFVPVWIGLTLISVFLEAVQTCLPGRVTSIADVITNSAGAMAGMLTAFIIHRWHRRIGAPRAGGLTPLWFMPAPLPLIALIAVVLWCLVQSSPWRFSLSVSSVRANFSFLVHQAWWDLSYWKLCLHLFAWSSIAASFVLAIKPYGPRLSGLVLAQLACIFLQALSTGASLSYEEIFAIALVWPLALAMRIGNSQMLSISVLLVSGWAALACYQLQPQPGTVGNWSWLPLVGRSHLMSSLNYAMVLAFFALPPCMAAAWGRKTRAWPLAYAFGIAACSLLIAVILELMQLRIPGRWADTSGPILILLTWLAIWSLGPFGPPVSASRPRSV